jgi:hypothetical protein
MLDLFQRAAIGRKTKKTPPSDQAQALKRLTMDGRTKLSLLLRELALSLEKHSLWAEEGRELGEKPPRNHYIFPKEMWNKPRIEMTWNYISHVRFFQKGKGPNQKERKSKLHDYTNTHVVYSQLVLCVCTCTGSRRKRPGRIYLPH